MTAASTFESLTDLGEMAVGTVTGTVFGLVPDVGGAISDALFKAALLAVAVIFVLVVIL